MGILDFLSREAGSERSEALNGLLSQFVPPNLRSTVGLLSELNPVTSMGRAGQASERMLAPGASGMERVGAAGDMLSNMAGVVAPALVAGRFGVPAANAITEGLTGLSMTPGAFALRDFGADETGAIKVYHASPHDFDRFSMSKIGTGVGAPDAYSRGLYFAENQSVAEHFKRLGASPMIGGVKGSRAGLSDDAFELVYKFTNDGSKGTLADVAARAEADLAARQSQLPASAIREYQKIIDELLSRGGEDVRLGANMYEVKINATPDTFADWDAPISEQGEKVRSALSAFPPEKTWKEIYESGMVRPEAVREKGLSGTTYKASDGSRNYVVFDENLIEIVRKYGIAGAAAMLGLSQADVAQAMDQQQPQGLLPRGPQ